MKLSLFPFGMSRRWNLCKSAAKRNLAMNSIQATPCLHALKALNHSKARRLPVKGIRVLCSGISSLCKIGKWSRPLSIHQIGTFACEGCQPYYNRMLHLILYTFIRSNNDLGFGRMENLQFLPLPKGHPTLCHRRTFHRQSNSKQPLWNSALRETRVRKVQPFMPYDTVQHERSSTSFFLGYIQQNHPDPQNSHTHNCLHFQH